jgi:hypothetical protein
LVFNYEQMALLHRHEDQWRELHEVSAPSVADEDVERRLLRGEKLYRCLDCDLEVIAKPPAAD